MKKAIVICLALLSFVAIQILIYPALSLAEPSLRNFHKIRWMTEEYAPYNYTENGVLKGISVDVLNEVWKRAGAENSKPEIEVLPWARGYMYLKKEKNACLFSMGITEERRKLFAFSNPIFDNKNSIIAKKSRGYKIGSIENLKSLTIGTLREDAGEQLLLSSGWKPENLERSSSPESLVRMLYKDRMDAISYGEDTTKYTMKRCGIDSNQYEVIYLIKTTESAFAFNIKTDAEILSQFNRILDGLKKDGTIEKIKAKYLH